MSSDDLSLFSYEILGLIGRTGASAHDLRQMVRRGRLMAWAGESQYYAEPKRLARLGYLDARPAPGKTRPRTVYTMTEKGRTALRAWAATPASVTPFKSEMLTRMLIADLVGEPATRAGIASVRADVADLLARLDEAEASAEALPHRRRYLLLSTSFMRRLLQLHLDWVAEVERELRDDGDRR